MTTLTPTTTFRPYAIDPAKLKRAEDRGELRTGSTELMLAARMRESVHAEGHRPRLPELPPQHMTTERRATADRILEALKAGPATARAIRAAIGADYQRVATALGQLDRLGKVISEHGGRGRNIRWRLPE